MKKIIRNFFIIQIFLLCACNNKINCKLVNVNQSKNLNESNIIYKEIQNLYGGPTDEWKTESDEEVESAKYRSNGIIEVSIERIENSIKNEDGEVIAIVYYDKPVVSGDSEVAKKINAFFDEEEENFRKGSGRLTLERDNYFDYFNNGVKTIEEKYGTEVLVNNPLHYVVETRIEFIDKDILSIFQMWDVQLGTLGWSYYGCTFDLNTGELVPITDLIEIEPKNIKQILEDGAKGSWDKVEYVDLKNNNYVITKYDTRIDMRYEYFFDGENYYLIDNWSYHDGYLYKWNGKWGSEYSIQNIQYILNWPNSNLIWKEE